MKGWGLVHNPVARFPTSLSCVPPRLARGCCSPGVLGPSPRLSPACGLWCLSGLASALPFCARAALCEVWVAENRLRSLYARPCSGLSENWPVREESESGARGEGGRWLEASPSGVPPSPPPSTSPAPRFSSLPGQAFVSVKTAADRAFGWGGTPVKWQHWCPEVGLSVTRNHAQEEKAKSLIDDEILGENPTRECEAYRSFAYLAIGFQAARIQR